MADGSRWASFCTRPAHLIVSSMSWLLLLAAPSVPKPTARPARRISTTGAIPEPKYMLLMGLCDTLTPCRQKISISSGRMRTQCTASTSGPKNPISSRKGTARWPYRAWVAWLSSAVSLTCRLMSRPRSVA